MRIAVIGAGIGGMVAANGLQADGHEVTIYEQRRDPNPDGAGLTLFGNAFAALDSIGLGNAVREVSSGTIASLRAGQRKPSGAWLVALPPDAVSSMRSVHRVALHRVLTDHLQPGTLRTERRALVAADGAPRVAIGDETKDFDLVIAADGIHSRCRSVLGLDTGLHYAGYTAWRGVTSQPVDIHGEAGETWGRGKLFGIVPLPDDRLYWFATLNTPVDTQFPDKYEAVRTQFADWHAPIPECIAATPRDRILRHDIYDLAKPLSSFVRGRTVLLGDAAHAMTPNLGQGAGQGIEDAATLTHVLRGADLKELDAVLARYSTLRLKRTTSIWRRSRAVGRVAQASNPIAVGLRDIALRLTPVWVFHRRSSAAETEPKIRSTTDE